MKKIEFIFNQIFWKIKIVIFSSLCFSKLSLFTSIVRTSLNFLDNFFFNFKSVKNLFEKDFFLNYMK